MSAHLAGVAHFHSASRSTTWIMSPRLSSGSEIGVPTGIAPSAGQTARVRPASANGFTPVAGTAGTVHRNRHHVPQLPPFVAPVGVVVEELEAPVEVADHRLREGEPRRVLGREHRARGRELLGRNLAAAAEAAQRVALAL